jgi:tRNA (guanine37-N1)-methyltransferase
MRFDIITLFPEEVLASLSFGVVGRALARGQIQVVCTTPRDFAFDAYRRVDDRVYGGGPGMVMLLEPLRLAVAHVRSLCDQPAPLTLLSPQGAPFTQAHARALSLRPRMILLCGRYEGIDERFQQHFVEEAISIGDYVLSGGELGAMVVLDAVARLLPGVLNTAASAEQDSFEDGLLDCPHYTKPEHCAYGSVPEVLKGGNHAEIARWRRMQSLGATWLKRPDLLAKRVLSSADAVLLREFQRAHALKTANTENPPP